MYLLLETLNWTGVPKSYLISVGRLRNYCQMLWWEGRYHTSISHSTVVPTVDVTYAQLMHYAWSSKHCIANMFKQSGSRIQYRHVELYLSSIVVIQRGSSVPDAQNTLQWNTDSFTLHLLLSEKIRRIWICQHLHFKYMLVCKCGFWSVGSTTSSQSEASLEYLS